MMEKAERKPEPRPPAAAGYTHAGNSFPTLLYSAATAHANTFWKSSVCLSRLIKMRERASERENYFKYLCRHQDIGKTEEKIKKGKNAEEEMEMRYCVELFIGFD